ncbi:MAG: hypothetical protein LUH07_00045 [Lachnospiraceae bacterium]|nr:hypothetical protein [Lachnospiraceae bacterium]
MRAIGIDVGTTTISVVMVDGGSGELLGSRTVSHNAFLKDPNPARKIQDPQKLWSLTKKTLAEVIQEYGRPDCIGMTGQMHGILYMDKAGNAVSPLYTWQDDSGNECMENGQTYAECLQKKAGKAATGFGLTTHYYLQKRKLLASEAVQMTTISDYIAMKLCGKSTSAIVKDMAASWGCYNLEQGDFYRSELEELGMDLSYLPELLPEYSVTGTTQEDLTAGIPAGIPVTASLGDNQASVIGSVRNLSDTVLVNIGTGSQISFGIEKYVESKGAIELRPCGNGLYIMVGSGLCGGRAYAMLEQFYREIMRNDPAENLYALMERQARDFMRTNGKKNAWKIRTTFSGTRINPNERGSMYGIGVDNFCPGAMTLGMLQGILEELFSMYQEMCLMAEKKALHLVGSGNGIRKNPLMQELAQDLFRMPMDIPVCQEEAAYGAALQAFVSAGQAGSLTEMQKKICYGSANKDTFFDKREPYNKAVTIV